MTRSDKPEQPIYLTTAELVERWRGQISASTLANWRAEGKGPCFVKVGGRILYPLDDVLAYERSRKAAN